MNRRTLLKSGGLAAVGVMTVPIAGCGPSKEKAVKYVGLIIDLSKEAPPLLNLLGAPTIAELVSDKVIPALEKLKDALSDADIPTSNSTLETVRNVLGGVATALLNLPDTPRRTTLIGILTSVRILLLTVEAFIDSEMPPAITGTSRSASTKKSTAQAIRQAFEATGP